MPRSNPVPRRYYDLNTYFRRCFGERVHKLSVDAGLTCPNRDGTKGSGGCIYCNARGSGTGAHARGLSISEQLLAAKTAVVRRFKAHRYLAYFQSFSNTYAPIDRLQAMYDEALAVPDVVGLAVGTRPDCVDEAVLNLLAGYAQHHMVWIEYGLQSAHDTTLARIHRGHDAATFERAVRTTAGRGISICAHIILGLPGEGRADMLATADYVGRLPIDGIKLHLLYVVAGTPMAALYAAGDYRPLSQSAYVDLVCDVLERLPSGMVIQRLTGDPRPSELLAPRWALRKPETYQRIQTRLVQRDSWQGKALGAPPAFRQNQGPARRPARQ
ncbi:TIGR01212 family radical SAM protein [Desulfatitalea alkaliphila]|uniref:TIGR01212 family radical SAM protein n=1 Tax=Desulfatitalea alkaliphila TaxID=2929485 RepID=A0AA41R693_9BACT|nr:TIGR01212 family radical SAM protein [Desulfatitalea alkaliphila]MCJ8501686.1 TIGR01212 family radical SAM protein [Desulfatitalea alkaliphila]